jgi:redox-regulated HSP33 family molecular chaperone
VTLGEKGLRQMIADKEKAEVQCQMCGRNYEMEVTDLESLVEEIRRNSMH